MYGLIISGQIIVVMCLKKNRGDDKYLISICYTPLVELTFPKTKVASNSTACLLLDKLNQIGSFFFNLIGLNLLLLECSIHSITFDCRSIPLSDNKVHISNKII